MGTIMHRDRRSAQDLDALYDRHAGELRTYADEQLTELDPAADGDLAEQLVERVWQDVARGLYPEGRRGLDGLLALLLGQVRAVRARAVAASHALREVVIDLDDTSDTVPLTAIRTRRPLPTTVAAAVASLRTLPLAG
ncbi:hypothetical protein [Kitasatospora sp. NPDC088134]|uniref:hypothetical protein n=1 Tax=Kitasatospora sp. NPDC088134 TaxID=3364071 RepID=UPI0037F52DC5